MAVDNAKGIDNLFLPEELKEDLKSIVFRMKNIQKIESAGGSLPTGLVFYGSEPGTGKTESARSIAKDSGWAFLATTSNDLIADGGLIDKLYSEALNIRPCIIFIDEANDVLRDRSMSNYGAITNKLLTVMDGVASERRDVMFIAATNFIEHIDPAVLRGGRISEKFHFTVPDHASQSEFMGSLLRKARVGMNEDIEAAWIVVTMANHGLTGTVANMTAVFQDAINEMIYRDAKDGQLSRRDFTKAIQKQMH